MACSIKPVELHQRPNPTHEPGWQLFVPPRREDQTVVAYGPSVLLPVVSRFRVQQNVVDPSSRLGGAQQVVAVEVSRCVDT